MSQPFPALEVIFKKVVHEAGDGSLSLLSNGCFSSMDYAMASHKACNLEVVVAGSTGVWKCDAFVFAQPRGLGMRTFGSAVEVYKFLGLTA